MLYVVSEKYKVILVKVAMNIHDYQVFFFDFDGLVIDTEPLYYRAFLTACRERGLDTSMDFSTYYLFSMLGREVFKQKFLELFPDTESFFHSVFMIANVSIRS